MGEDWEACDWEARFAAWWTVWFCEQLVQAKAEGRPLKLHRDLTWAFYSTLIIQRLLVVDEVGMSILGVAIEWVDGPSQAC